MTCRTETVDALAYRFCPDDTPVLADRIRAVLRARVLDEITEESMEVDLTLTSSVHGVTPRAAQGGRVGLVGQPARAFPGLDVNPLEFDLRIAARGYLPLDLAGTLGPIAGSPDQFAALDLGDVGMHRAAIALRGRTLQRASLAPTVVSGATVSIVGHWPTFPPANVAPPAVMQAPNLINVVPGSYASRAAATTSVQRRDLLPVPGQEKILVFPAVAGTLRLRLSNRIGLLPGVPLIVDDNDPGRRERILIDQVDTASADDEPAWITLAHRLAYTHMDGALCRPGSLQVPGAVNALTRAAIRGDETVFLDGLTGLSSGIVVELDDGVSPPEYHEMQLYQTASDADGYFRLPPIARVAMVLLHAEQLDFVSPDDASVAPDYRVAENRITVMFP